MIKINSLNLENVKRVKAVKLEPTANGLTVIGGKNGQGKTSVLDAIAWALGGAKYAPSMATREGSYVPAQLEVVLSNGLKVTRSGANGTLKVHDPSGNKAGQKLLDSFINELALNLPKFMEMSDKEKADCLLSLLGVDTVLVKIEQQIGEIYQERREVGRIADSKEKHALEMPQYGDVPDAPISVSELIMAQQEVLARNGENQRKRLERDKIQANVNATQDKLIELQNQVRELTEKYNAMLLDLEVANTSVEDLQDESTAELEHQIKNAEAINEKIRANMAKYEAAIEAGEFRQQYDDLSKRLEQVRDEKTALLKSVKMPIEDLSIDDGKLTYKGKNWDCMSGAEQLKVSTAIVRALNPDCGFVLMDKLEQMDVDSMREFGTWLEQEGLQVIATRVSTNADECSIIIEDGSVVSNIATTESEKKWGEF